MDHCVSINEVDATPNFVTRKVAEPFASQPLFCELLMIYPDTSRETVWVHSSLHDIVNKIGIFTHANNFTPRVDINAIGREWAQKARFLASKQ